MRILLATTIVILSIMVAEAQICGNGIVESGEQCEVGGLGCVNCRCVTGYTTTIPVSRNCRVATGNIPYCNYTRGYWCIKDGVHNDYYYLCNLPAASGYGYCGNGYTCKGQTGFYTDSSPCVLKTSYGVCGNGIIESGEQCDRGYGCNNSTCQCRAGFEPAIPPATYCICKPDTTCAALNYECGLLDDGCKTVNCGTCPTGRTCQNHRCVTATNTCGNGVINTGEQCDGGLGCLNCRCISGYIPTDPISVNCRLNSSSCTPRYNCASYGAVCGFVYDGCQDIYCGTCPSGYSCVNNRCQSSTCVPTVSCSGRCGVIYNGCENVNCGNCQSGYSCVNGYCQGSCTPTITCSGRCGTIFNGCENVNCGTCPTGYSCVNNQCQSTSCTPSVTCTGRCGTLYNGCENVDCGNCQTGYNCVNNICQSSGGGLTCSSVGLECGILYDPNTGTTTNCGDCPSGQECNLGKCS